MSDWTAFAVSIVVLTLVLLYATRHSSRTLERVRIVDSSDDVAFDPGSTAEPNPGMWGGSDPTASRPDEPRDRIVESPIDNPSTADPPTDGPTPASDLASGQGRPTGDPTNVDEGGSRMKSAVEDVPTIPRRLLLVNVTLTQLIAFTVLLAIAYWTGVPAEAFGYVPAANMWTVLATGVVVGVSGYFLSESVVGTLERAGYAASERLREAMAPSTAGEWALLLGVILPIIAVFEEALFRGAMIGAFAFGFGIDPWLLAVVSAVAFGLGHGAQGRVGIAVTALLGLYLAAVFVLTGSLVVVIVAHYVINALEFVVREGLG